MYVLFFFLIYFFDVVIWGFFNDYVLFIDLIEFVCINFFVRWCYIFGLMFSLGVVVGRLILLLFSDNVIVLGLSCCCFL